MSYATEDVCREAGIESTQEDREYADVYVREVLDSRSVAIKLVRPDKVHFLESIAVAFVGCRSVSRVAEKIRFNGEDQGDADIRFWKRKLIAAEGEITRKKLGMAATETQWGDIVLGISGDHHSAKYNKLIK